MTLEGEKSDKDLDNGLKIRLGDKIFLIKITLEVFTFKKSSLNLYGSG